MFLTVHCCFEVHQVSEITVKTSAARDVYIYENKYYTMSTELESFLTIWSVGETIFRKLSMAFTFHHSTMKWLIM